MGRNILDTLSQRFDGAQPTGVKAVLLTIFYVFVAIITAGVIVGYGQLYPILVSSGVYHWRCPTANFSLEAEEAFDQVAAPRGKTTCPAQDEALDNLEALGNAVSIFIQFPSGVLLDLAGPKITAWAGLAMLIPGSLLMAYSTPTFDGYLVGFLLLSAGGPLVFVSTLHAPALFPSRSAMILTILNGAFGGAALVFLVFNVMYFNLGVSFKALFLTYTGMISVIFLLTFFLWPWKKYEPIIPAREGYDAIADDIKVVNSDGTEPPSPRPSLYPNPEAARTSLNTSSDSIGSGTGIGIDVASMYWRSLKADILNPHFAFLCFFVPLMVTNGNFFLSTSPQQFARITNSTQDRDFYGKLLDLEIPIIGMLVAPLGIIIDSAGISVGILMFVVICCCSTLCGLFPIVWLQGIRYTLFSIYLPLTFTIWADFILKRFGYKNYGVLFGIIALLSGFVSLANFPLIPFVLEPHPFDAFHWVNITWIALTGVMVIYPILLDGKRFWRGLGHLQARMRTCTKATRL